MQHAISLIEEIQNILLKKIPPAPLEGDCKGWHATYDKYRGIEISLYENKGRTQYHIYNGKRSSSSQTGFLNLFKTQEDAVIGLIYDTIWCQAETIHDIHAKLKHKEWSIY